MKHKHPKLRGAFKRIPGGVFILILVISKISYAEQQVSYQASFDNAVHHEARIVARFEGVSTPVLELRMSRSSPGRYALHEFAKNVYSVEMFDGKGKALGFSRPDPFQWNVTGHDGTVVVKYTLYADRAGGTYSGIDRTHAHLNMPACFIWARGFDRAPIKITFKPFDRRWKVATQLVKTKEPYTFTAPNLQYFMDSPTELSDFSLRQWKVKSNGKSYTLKLAVHHDGVEQDVDIFARQAKAVVAEQVKVFGELPDFDYGEYIFLGDYLEHVARDGMEHRNSTVMTSQWSLDDLGFAQLDTLSHEFFHAWNVERLRPKSLQPFNFEKANMSSELWFAEGFTRYYGNLLIRRADQETVKQYLRKLTDTLNAFINAPGRNYFSADGMSRLAPFVDAATAMDPTNFENIFISYYIYGAAVALALDLTLRSEFKDISLDTFMRQAWQDYGRDERYYDNDDLKASLAKVSNQAFADGFFARYILGHELPDFKSLLAKAGVLLERKYIDCPSIGSVEIEFNDREAVVDSPTIVGSPLYKAGLDRGDHIIRFDRRKVRGEHSWFRIMNRYRPGDKAKLYYRQRGQDLSTEIVFVEDPTLKAVTYKAANLPETEAMLNFREAWLGKEANKESQIGYHSRNNGKSSRHCQMR